MLLLNLLRIKKDVPWTITAIFSYPFPFQVSAWWWKSPRPPWRKQREPTFPIASSSTERLQTSRVHQDGAVTWHHYKLTTLIPSRSCQSSSIWKKLCQVTINWWCRHDVQASNPLETAPHHFHFSEVFHHLFPSLIPKKSPPVEASWKKCIRTRLEAFINIRGRWEASLVSGQPMPGEK